MQRRPRSVVVGQAELAGFGRRAVPRAWAGTNAGCALRRVTSDVLGGWRSSAGLATRRAQPSANSSPGQVCGRRLCSAPDAFLESKPAAARPPTSCDDRRCAPAWMFDQPSSPPELAQLKDFARFETRKALTGAARNRTISCGLALVVLMRGLRNWHVFDHHLPAILKRRP